jgi:hypothetical protein
VLFSPDVTRCNPAAMRQPRDHLHENTDLEHDVYVWRFAWGSVRQTGSAEGGEVRLFHFDFLVFGTWGVNDGDDHSTMGRAVQYVQYGTVQRIAVQYRSYWMWAAKRGTSGSPFS